jgi:hypothetical protein
MPNVNTKKYIPKEIVSSLSLVMIPIISQYNSSCCATCGTPMPFLKTIEEFPPIEYSLNFYAAPSLNGLLFTVRKLFCCNDHENMIEVLVTLDLLEDYLSPTEYNSLLDNLKES